MADLYPHVDDAIAYARGVTDSSIAAPRLVRLACERFERDLAACQQPDSPWQWRPDLAERPIRFASLLQNIKGKEAGKPLRLMAWQKFAFANLFGFVERGTDTRRFRQGTIWVPRGNGKTTIAAPLALYLTFVEGEGGAEGYAAAVTRDQARLLFDTAKNMVLRSPEFRHAYGVEAGAHTIYQLRSASKFLAISSDAKALDGLNVQAGILDEIGSHKTDEVYSILLTACGKRKHPLLISISTATGNTSGIGKQLWDYGARIVERKQDDDRLFALIYCADSDDDPWEEATWAKVNPSWGQSVQPDAIRAIAQQARNNPAQESAFKTRFLNIWTGADDALFSMAAWAANADPALRLDELEGQPCHIALDLASRSDLAAVAIVFPARDPETGLTTYKAFARCYLNETAVREARNASYPGWAQGGHLIVTPGNETDFSVIEADILDLCRRFDVTSVAYDPWGATQLAQRLQAEGVPVVEFRATMQNFSEPTKEVEAATRAGRLRHDGNPVLAWCIGNVVGFYDARANVYPKKARPEQKIDAAVALIMSVARAMVIEETTTSIFDRAALWN